MKHYAGIGARATPHEICDTMKITAMMLASHGWTMRSGGAHMGADEAFKQGCKLVNGPMVIRHGTSLRRYLEHAAMFHPAWNKCDNYAKALHARNSLIMLGDELDDPVEFVICYTPAGGIVGGTGQSIRIAIAYNIPVFNLYDDPTASKFWEWFNARN